MINSSFQKGVIKNRIGNLFEVEVNCLSACSECHSKQACKMINQEKKIIEVDAQSGYAIGDDVIVELDDRAGLQAIFIGYLLPFIIMLVVLIFLMEILESELWAGTASILALLPYYLILFFFKTRMKKRFQFRIKKI